MIDLRQDSFQVNAIRSGQFQECRRCSMTVPVGARLDGGRRAMPWEPAGDPAAESFHGGVPVGQGVGHWPGSDGGACACRANSVGIFSHK